MSRHAVILLGGCLVAVYGLFFASSYDQRILTLSGIYVIMVLGYQFIFGHAGALSLAQGAFFGIGAYTTGILGSQYGAEFLLTFPLSIALAAALAAVASVPVLRLKTHYFALATLALSQLLLLIAVNWEAVTGGANGLPGVPPVEIFGVAVTRGTPLLLFVWAIAGAAMLIAAWQLRGGRIAAFTVMRETPLAAPIFGIDSGLLRLRAFLLSAAFGGAAGALFVHTNRVVSPETLGFGIMITCLTMTVVGGRFGIPGAVAGALLLTHLPEWFRGLDEYYLVAVGALLLAAVVFAPNGIVALILPDRPQPDRRPSRAKRVPVTPSAPKNTGLEARCLEKSYGGVRALDGVDLRFGGGEIVGVIGPNGAGKTTLANALTGLTQLDRGHITFSGRDIAAAPAHTIARAGLTRSFQTPQLPDALSVRQAIETAQIANGQTPDANDVLHPLELSDQAETACGTLPHGLRRRVELCRAIATRPAVLILDEPAAGLTPEEQAGIGDICKTLAESGMGILLIDHNIDFLAPLATRLICMDAGRIIADGTPEQTLTNPTVRAAYFGVTG
jgi:branched-chain amino acid transport system permease protein